MPCTVLYVHGMTRPAKSEVYRWRLSPRLKAELEAAAKADRTTVDAILGRLAREWLAKRAPRKKSDADEAKVRATLMACAGFYKGNGTSATNEQVREVMGEYLEAKYRRRSSR